MIKVKSRADLEQFAPGKKSQITTPTPSADDPATVLSKAVSAMTEAMQLQATQAAQSQHAIAELFASLHAQPKNLIDMEADIVRDQQGKMTKVIIRGKA